MIHKAEDIEINPYYLTLFSQSELVGFLDVSRVVEAWRRYQEAPDRAHLYTMLTADEQRLLENSFGHLSVRCTLRNSGEERWVMPVFFFNGADFPHWGEHGFVFDTENAAGREPDFSKKFILFYKGSDDWSVGMRFASAEERQEFLELYAEEAGFEQLEGWN